MSTVTTQAVVAVLHKATADRACRVSGTCVTRGGFWVTRSGREDQVTVRYLHPLSNETVVAKRLAVYREALEEAGYKVTLVDEARLVVERKEEAA